MSKVYKGYELIKAIAAGEIKENTRFREMEENRYYIVKDRKLWEQEDIGIYNSKLENLQITYGVFELIEDEEIDIQSIEELDTHTFDSNARTITIQNRNKINEILEAVKQLDKRTINLQSN